MSYASLAWGIGASLTSALAYFVVDTYGWRGLMIGTAIMFSPSIFFLAIMPESPRFDAKKGNWERAERTLQTVAKLNCTTRSTTFRLKRGQQSEDMEADISGIQRCSDGWWFTALCGCCSSLTYIRSHGLLKNLIVITTLGSAATFIYYAVSYSISRFLNEGYCSDKIVPLESSCHFDKSVLFDLGIISLFEPLGVLVAIVMIETRLGRKMTFQSSVLLLLVATASLYMCVNKTYTFVCFTISKFAAAQIEYSLYILGTEHFPTEVRSFVIAVGLGFWRVGASAGIATAQFIFTLNPRLVLAFTQIAAVVVSVCLCVLGKETAGTHIE